MLLRTLGARGVAAGLAILLVCGSPATAQTTQGLISGKLQNSQSGAPISGAQVTCWNALTGATVTARSDAGGNYFLPLLSPGNYRVRATADAYQAREVQELELPVAGRLELNFQLRPLNDVWEAGQYRSVFLPGSRTIVTFYGPDVDSSRSGSFEAARARRGALESTLSQVIDPVQVRDLPLNGRDVYTMLVTQANVAADTATGRGLGLSITGQRPSSSNFLLDGLENNNYLVTGPLTSIAPEAIQEYRVSTNNFSAEYGRTSGFLANAVSKSGGNQLHGLGYFYLKNDALNANGFQENLAGLPRPPAKERQLGYQVGGPVRRERLFFSSAYEHLRSRSRQDYFDFNLPTPQFVQFQLPTRASRRLLERYPSPAAGDGRNFFQTLRLAPPVSVDRSLQIHRLDYTSPSGANRVMARAALVDVSRPDFIWSPYKDFVSGLEQDTVGIAVSYMRTLRPGLMNEARLGRSRDDLGWDRAHPEVPTLVSGDDVFLPGSLAAYAYRNNNQTWEFLDNLVWTRGRRVVTAGGGFLLRKIDGFLTLGRDAEYRFPNAFQFGVDRPFTFRATINRDNLPAFRLPDFNREYRYNQFFFFAQESFRVTPRLALNYGLRYERFGAPRNVGATKDALVELGSGPGPWERLTNSKIVIPTGGDQQLYRPDTNDWAGRFGFSYDLRGNARTLLRGAYGIFYDRPFDNLWQNVRSNRWLLPFVTFRGAFSDYLSPVSSALERIQALPEAQIAAEISDFPDVTLIDPNLRSGYAQTYFLGVQQQLWDNWVAEVNGAGSLGRKLVLTDRWNRDHRVPRHGSVSYRSSQGLSNYQALSLVARYRSPRRQFQIAYTWSHSIDHQSEPISGDFFNLLFTRVGGGARQGISALSQEFDLRGDRGNSDFDQRHNLVFFSVWELPGAFSGRRVGWLFRDWKFSQLAAFRSGFPFSLVAEAINLDRAYPYNNRPDVIDPRRVWLDQPVAVEGGQRLLNVAAFSQPEPGVVGNSGRNALRGPGLYNIDISLARSFPVKWLGESGRLTVRADAFNFLNRANLNNPDPLILSPDFGVARYGRLGRQSGFPAVSPLNESARQVQLMMRVEF